MNLTFMCWHWGKQNKAWVVCQLYLNTQEVAYLHICFCWNDTGTLKKTSSNSLTLMLFEHVPNMPTWRVYSGFKISDYLNSMNRWKVSIIVQVVRNFRFGYLIFYWSRSSQLHLEIFLFIKWHPIEEYFWPIKHCQPNEYQNSMWLWTN